MDRAIRCAAVLAMWGVALNVGVCLCAESHHHGEDSAGSGVPTHVCSCEGPGAAIVQESCPIVLPREMTIRPPAVAVQEPAFRPRGAVTIATTGAGPPRPSDVALHLRIRKLTQ
ncbi:MAG: hypothetical protein HYY16_18070 [Planctomycetes bacterium]|nr:hypothetical protein [Planctomycetota bacterium]